MKLNFDIISQYFILIKIIIFPFKNFNKKSKIIINLGLNI